MLPTTTERTRRIGTPRQYVFDVVVDFQTWPLWLGAEPEEDRCVLGEGHRLHITLRGVRDRSRIHVSVETVWPGQYLLIRLQCGHGGELEQEWFFADASEGSSTVTVVTRIESWGQSLSCASASDDTIRAALEQILDSLAELATRYFAEQ